MKKLVGKKFDSYSSAEIAAWKWLEENKSCGAWDCMKRREFRHYAYVAVKEKPYRIYIFPSDIEGFDAYFFSTPEEGKAYAEKIRKKKLSQVEVADPIPQEFLSMYEEGNKIVADDRKDEVGVASAKPKADLLEDRRNRILSDEEKSARKQKRLENERRRIELAKELEAKNKALTENVRLQLAGLSERDNLVFWAIRDGHATGGVKEKDLSSLLGQSTAGITRSIARLRKLGMIERVGSKKTGFLVCKGEAAETTRCFECVHKEKCGGYLKWCGAFEPGN